MYEISIKFVVVESENDSAAGSVSDRSADIRLFKSENFPRIRIFSFNKYEISIRKMSGAKAPDFDAYGLLRATHSHNPTQYSHIVGLSSHFYAHIGADPKVFHPPMSKLMWA